jgi:hypothetical protein
MAAKVIRKTEKKKDLRFHNVQQYTTRLQVRPKSRTFAHGNIATES